MMLVMWLRMLLWSLRARGKWRSFGNARRTIISRTFIRVRICSRDFGRAILDLRTHRGLGLRIRIRFGLRDIASDIRIRCAIEGGCRFSIADRGGKWAGCGRSLLGLGTGHVEIHGLGMLDGATGLVPTRETI